MYNRYEEIFEYFGIVTQLKKYREESLELALALTRLDLGRQKALDDVIGEVADCIIVSSQLGVSTIKDFTLNFLRDFKGYGFECSLARVLEHTELIDMEIERKLTRTIKRIRSGYYEKER